MSTVTTLNLLVVLNLLLAVFYGRKPATQSIRKVVLTVWRASGLAFIVILAWSVVISDTRSLLFSALGLITSTLTLRGATQWKIGEKFPGLKEILSRQHTTTKQPDVILLFVFILSPALVAACLMLFFEPTMDVAQLSGRALFAGVLVGLLLYAGDNRKQPKK